MISRRFVFLAAVFAFCGSVGMSRAQDTSASSSGSPSLGDAARKARAQKKDSATKPAKVFTNDDVGGLKGTISVVGNGSGPQSGTDRTAEKSGGKNPNDAGKEEGSWRAKFAAARQTLAADEKELDILQREFNLKQQQFYTDPTAALKEQHSREDLNSTQSQIDAKKQAVEKDKQALSDLEDELHKAGGNARWADEPSGSGPSQPNNSGSGASGGASKSASANSDTPEPHN
jgi:hypothetical protein